MYTHAAVWATLAFAELGDAECAWELFALINPVHHSSTPAEIATYKVEPYVFVGDVYAFPPHAGRGGWTWYTGSAGWMYQLIVESLLGVKRSGTQLLVRPLLPQAWTSFDMDYRFGSSTYHIVCLKAESAILANVLLDGNETVARAIPLVDDGKTHSVIVEVWREPLEALRRCRLAVTGGGRRS